MLQQIGIILCLVGLALNITQEPKPVLPFDESASLYATMQKLGGEKVSHELNSTIPGFSAAKGSELFHTGVTVKPNGKKTRKQSKHFVCTSCHNIVKEDPDIANPDPEARLTYAQNRGLPFLQGTTLYGAVNRVSFYKGD